MISITQDLKFKQAVVEYSFKHTSSFFYYGLKLLTYGNKYVKIYIT